MIRQTTSEDLHSIKQLTEACAKALESRGIYQWNQHYPSRERLQQDIEKQELYVLEEDNSIIAIIVITPVMDEEYFPVKWFTENGANLYIHRLATHPFFWGRGIARRLMDFAEDFARQQNYISVRLDTFSQNKRNQRFL